VWSRRFFHELATLEGDVGARHLIGRYPEAVVEMPVADRAALIDVDTPEALNRVKAEIERG
jgi:molybdenum cofactor cytidylyltransferase